MEISDFLTQARDSNYEIRKLGEDRIEQTALSNFGQFMYACSRELADDNKLRLNRQLAATLIKNMLNYMPKFVGKWETLGQDLKSEVKSAVLSTLASVDLDIRKAAALCVAGIYRLEQPTNQWPDLIAVLVKTCSNDNQNFQTAAIMALGYISQEVNQSDFCVADVDKILSAFILLLKTPNLNIEVLKTTLISFMNYIPFAKKNFEEQVIDILLTQQREKEQLSWT